jgi:hypothetical protein
MKLLAKKNLKANMKTKLLLAVVIGAVCLLSAANRPLSAEDLDPIDVDKHNWMSLDHYTDKATRFPDALGQVQEDPPQPPATSSADVAQTKQENQENAYGEGEKTGEPVLAQPVRPLNLPVMPGLNLDYDVNVTSTVEDKDGEAAELGEGILAQPVRPLNLPVMPGLGLSAAAKDDPNVNAANATGHADPVDDALWRDAKTTAKETPSGENDEGRAPLSVRFAELPDSHTVSATGSPVTKPHKKAQTVKEAKAKAPTPANPEACAALTAYRQRQLAAIESDRQTLDALQAAIAELGLDKKLDFMRGASQNLTAIPKSSETAAAETTGKINASLPSPDGNDDIRKR